ncbi:hypothetical protein NQ176_g7170 [Zarea fungicola]|uniref:Uncharacterized protein n=1 Tax=Zarea fungicola TaxID=93591 RepID=A0ACC1N039_9HYPO|nr:hypothetical protein NQ176_g7170 [Lecanicillium fungicola]
MKLQFITLSLATVVLSTPLVLKDTTSPLDNSTIIACAEGTTDPICNLHRQPTQHVITDITHPNGTTEMVRNKYTREQLNAIRTANNVKSAQFAPGEASSAASKREVAPPVCYTETQRWYDTDSWGYWYQSWNQVGSCFYCDDCSEAISTSFAVSQTWTYGLGVSFDSVIQSTFQFSWGETFTLSDTRTCVWNNVQNGCHSIWYQPLMSYHNGYANYQTHAHCYAGAGSAASDSYYNHNYAFANVNQAGNNGVNQGNLGCDSGCQGSDGRQCQYGNGGGSPWPYAN